MSQYSQYSQSSPNIFTPQPSRPLPPNGRKWRPLPPDKPAAPCKPLPLPPSNGDDLPQIQSFHIKKFPKHKTKRKQTVKTKSKAKTKSKTKTKSKSKSKNKRKYDRHDERKYDEAHFTEAQNSAMHWVRGDLVGIGSFGKVYKGYDKNTGKMCAIKQIPFDPNSLNHKLNHKLNAKSSKGSRLSLIEREVSVMKQLKHENIIEFYDYECNVKYRTLCILMEYVDGHSIDYIYKKNGAFSEDLIRKYTRQIMRGLGFAHKSGIIHRDIKGTNILISHVGFVKIADFGSAKLCDTTFGKMHKLEPSMDYQYTPLWTAPEVLVNIGYDDKIDIWSVGCVLIEMATAKQPWSECAFQSVFAALYHIGQPDNYPQYPNTLSKDCRDFIRLCLIRDVSKRCTAVELLRHKFLDEV